MKKLLNLSNHLSINWSDDQKGEWDEIIDIPFPNVDPNMNEEEVILLAKDFANRIKETNITNIMLQGEFSFVFILQQLLIEEGGFKFFFPTTERVVVEEKDGVKKSVFKFVRWRQISFHRRITFNIDGILQTTGCTPHSINEQLEWAGDNKMNIQVKDVEGVFDIPSTDKTAEKEDIWR